jgi:hypothetical protein
MSLIVAPTYRSCYCSNVAELMVWWRSRVKDLQDAVKAEQDGSAKRERLRHEEFRRRQRELWGCEF